MFSTSKIESLQLALKSLALYDGNIDGIVGPLTLAAIRKFDAFYADKPFVPKPASVDSIQKSSLTNSLSDSQGADIDEALIFTLENEGGFTDHPDDKGGATNKGITIGDLSTFLGKKATRDDVINISPETIRSIYQKYYWDVLKLNNIFDQSIATVLFDMSVLCGPGTAMRLCQEVLGVNSTQKMDTQTLAALNQVSDESFIPSFAAKNIERFRQIAQKAPSQAVFLQGWINRADRLQTLINRDDIDAIVPTLPPGTSPGEGLYELAAQVGVPEADITKMIAWQKTHNPTSNPRYWVVFKITEHSKNRRMHIFDRIDQACQSVHAVHGTRSDIDNDGVATDFSNEPESHKSAVGLYRTLTTYTMAKHGRALRLEGLEKSNNNALKRGIVFHGVPYAGDEYVRLNGRCGRSWGCPAVEYAVVQDLIDKIKGGSLLLIS